MHVSNPRLSGDPAKSHELTEEPRHQQETHTQEASGKDAAAAEYWEQWAEDLAGWRSHPELTWGSWGLLSLPPRISRGSRTHSAHRECSLPRLARKVLEILRWGLSTGRKLGVWPKRKANGISKMTAKGGPRMDTVPRPKGKCGRHSQKVQRTLRRWNKIRKLLPRGKTKVRKEPKLVHCNAYLWIYRTGMIMEDWNISLTEYYKHGEGGRGNGPAVLKELLIHHNMQSTEDVSDGYGAGTPGWLVG